MRAGGVPLGWAFAVAALIGGPQAVAHPGHETKIVAVAGSKPTGGTARRWLAGDHHVHSRFSVQWKPAEDGVSAPTPILAGDARYPIPTNAEMAVKHGLSWMVSTDHGGPNHAKLNSEQAYPELLRARRAFPGLIQFYGMELDTPGADHSSLIIPRTSAERDVLFRIERAFSKREAWPQDPARDAEPRMIEALKHMRAVDAPPVVIANHPSRSAKRLGEYGATGPVELRDWNDTAPQVAVGMEGAPGHQASALKPDGSIDPEGARGGYRNAPTLGGFDPMTARLGGFWDSMLGEGRRWWITSTSDSHRNYRDGGNDFWPGEYSKTFVKAAKTHADILDGLRNGRVFVATGDLVSEADVVVRAVGQAGPGAEIGGRLKVAKGVDLVVTIRLRDPAGPNHGGRTPQLARVDLIHGEVRGPVADRATDVNPTTKVLTRFGPTDWARDGERLSMIFTIRNVQSAGYIRVRGSSGAELEPSADPPGEHPWSDLWFYTNPIFIEVP